MKKWKRVLAVAAAASFALSSTSFQSLAYTENVSEENVEQDELAEKSEEETSKEETSEEKTSKEETSKEETVEEKTSDGESSEKETSDDETGKDATSDDAKVSNLEDAVDANADAAKKDAAEEEGSETDYKDGKYRGSAKGRNGQVTVEVTVEGGKIVSIEVIEQSETKRFWSKAIAVIDSIINNQSTDVDGVSGATLSSNAIKEATKNALASEPIQEEAEETTSLSGQGTKDDPFVISTEKELIFFRDSVNEGESYQGQYISQTDDIEITSDWTPIGTGKDKPFSGLYDGNGYSITNVTVTNDSVATDGTSYYAGLFGYITTYADLANINLSNVQINVTDRDGILYAGSLAACMYNTVTDGSQYTVIDNCSATGSINAGTVLKSTMTGGLLGMANQYAAITNNTVNVSVNASTNNTIGYVGGIVGMASMNGFVANNAVLSDVTITSTNANATAGGIVGQAATCLIFNNYSKGNVSGTKSGGVVGNSLTNSWLIADYYNSEKAYGANLGSVDSDSVLNKSAEEMSTADFATLMHSNLAPSALSGFAEKVGANGKINFYNYLARVENYYDWELSGSSVVISNNVWADAPESADDSIFESGDGSQDNPYIIATEAQLRAFATSLSEDNTYKGKFIKLANDIELTEGDWTPIGEGEYAFNGAFDGAGHTVSGLNIGSADNHHHDEGTMYYGFFGVLDGDSLVKDFTLNVNIYVEGDANVYVAGLAGYLAGTVDSVTVNGNVWGRSGLTNETANHFGGGLAGYLYRANVLNCVNNASVYAQAVGGVAEAGGIGGLNNRSLIANCVGNGKISGSADRKAEGMASLGGIIGVHAGTMVSCVANAEIESVDYSMYVGELAGWATGIAVLYDNFYNTDASEIIEGKNVNPVESVGWLVGPGTTEENETYAGGVNSGAIGVKGTEITSADFAKRLNDLFAEYPVQVSDFTTEVSLRKWNAVNGSVLPNGEVTGYTYKEPVVEKEEEETKAVSGEFYGRSSDGTTILKLYYDENGKLVIEVVSGDADENSDAYKEAYAAAITKMEYDDHTGYGKVDPSIFESGDGTESNPYIISSEQQLVDFNKSLNADENYEGTYVALGSDISLTNEWVLAGGSNPYPFKGVFDGKGYTISGLRIGSEDSPASYKYTGLFAYLNGAQVKNLNLSDAKIYSKTNGDSRFYAGVLSGASEADGTNGYIDSVNVTNAYVNLSTNSGAAYAAGLIGYDTDNVIANCKVDATVVANSKSAWTYAGVLTGLTAWSGVVNNRVSGSITVSSNLNKAAAGGIAGMMAAATYSNAADVTISSERYTNDLGQVSGRNTGVSYGSSDYYNSEALVVCGGEAVETKAVGSIVEGATTTEFYGMTGAEFNSSALLDKLNAAGDAAAYQEFLTFLNDSWSLDFAARTSIKPWTTASVNEPEKEDENKEEKSDVKPGNAGNTSNPEATESTNSESTKSESTDLSSTSTGSSSSSSSDSSSGDSISAGSSSASSSGATVTTTANASTATSIADESVPAAGSTKETTINSSKNSSNSKKNSISSTQNAAGEENAEVNADENVDEDNVETEVNNEKAEENTDKIEDTEVPTTAQDTTAIDNKDSSNGIVPIVVGIVAVAAAAAIGFQAYSIRKKNR